MNWLTEKLNPTIIGLFLIGLLIGGIVIGIVDTKRPTPLFSSADGGGAVILEYCSSEADALAEFVANIPHPIPQVYYQYYLHQTGALISAVLTCTDEAQAAFIAEWQPEVDAWQAEYDPILAEYEVAQDYYQATVRDAQEAYSTYQNNCVINPTDYRGGKTEVQPQVDATRKIAPSSKEVTAGRDTDYPDCQELWDAYLDATAESEQAEAEAQQIYAEVETLRAVWYDLLDQRQNFDDDYEFTRDYAWGFNGLEETPPYGQSPYSYYNDHDGRAAY